MVSQVLDAIGSQVSALDNHHAIDARMVDQLRTQNAWLAGDDKPRPTACDTAGSSVADNVHFRVMAADLHACAGLHTLSISKALFASAQRAATSRPPVVPVHQNHVASGIEQKRTELAARAVGSLSQREALLDSNADVFVFHKRVIALGRQTHNPDRY